MLTIEERMLAVYHARHFGHDNSQPKVPIPTGPIDWDSLPFSVAGGGR